MEELAKLPDNWNSRPDDMLGESVSSYLTSPRRKKRTTWIGGTKEEEAKPAATHTTKLKSSWVALGDDDKDDDTKDEPTPSNRPRNTNSVIMQKLSELSKHNDEVHEENEKLEVNPRRHSYKPQTATSTAAFKSTDSRASTETTESAESVADISSPSSNKEKITLQRTDIFSCNVERPNVWMGGEGEEAQPYSYIRSPKTKLRSSWLKETEKNDMESEIKPPFEAASRRMTSPSVLQKLSEFSQKNEENHARNESLAAKHTEVVQPRVEKAKASAVSSGKEKGEPKEVPKATAKGETISLQRTDISYTAERPSDWMGGEGEPAETNSYLHTPKTKLRTSWLQKSNEESQSLRDVTAGASEKEKKGGKFDLNASAPSLSLLPAQRRQTCPLVMQKLSELNQKNEEIHEKNEGLSVQKKGTEAPKKTSSPKPKGAAEKPSPISPRKEKVKFQSEEKISLQRTDISYMAERPNDWMGGEGESAEMSYLRSPKTKLRASWLQNGTSGSQSLRDVFTGSNDTTNR